MNNIINSILFSCRGHKDVIYNLEWNPYDVDKLVSVGVKHIKFWTLNGKQSLINRSEFLVDRAKFLEG